MIFQVRAVDPDSTVPSLVAVGLPENASFADSGNGSGGFAFEPDSLQAGIHSVTFIASDDALADSETVAITVIALRTTTTWQLEFGGTGDESAVGAVSVADDGWIVGAQFPARNAVEFYRVDLHGNLYWRRSVVVDGWWEKIASAGDGGVILAGHTDDDRTLPRSFGCLLGIDSAAAKLWSSKVYTPSDLDNAVYSICATMDGGLVHVGWVMTGGMTARMSKFGGSGNWTREYPDGLWFSDVAAVGNEGFAAVGAGFTDTSSQDLYVVRTGVSGIPIWERMFGGPHSEEAMALVVTSDGGCVVAGNSLSGATGPSDVYVVRVDDTGNKMWEHTYGGTSSDLVHAITRAGDAAFVIAGTTQSFGARGWDIYLIKIDASGNKVWERTFGGPKDESTSSVSLAPDGGFLISGTTASYGAGGTDIYLIKTDAMGQVEAHMH